MEPLTLNGEPIRRVADYFDIEEGDYRRDVPQVLMVRLDEPVKFSSGAILNYVRMNGQRIFIDWVPE